MVNINAIGDHVISLLKNSLPASLTYHSVDHTMDVVTEAMILAKEEGISDLQILKELQIAALYHDTGFLYAYKGHEEKSIELARRELHVFGLKEDEISSISELIFATKVPQRPKGIIQQILCDADLDYLGRDDFFINSERLHKEFIEYNIVSSEEEWEISRIEFIQAHTYFTKSQKLRRDYKKKEHLNQLILLRNN